MLPTQKPPLPPRAVMAPLTAIDVELAMRIAPPPAPPPLPFENPLNAPPAPPEPPASGSRNSFPYVPPAAPVDAVSPPETA